MTETPESPVKIPTNSYLGGIISILLGLKLCVKSYLFLDGCGIGIMLIEGVLFRYAGILFIKVHH